MRNAKIKMVKESSFNNTRPLCARETK